MKRIRFSKHAEAKFKVLLEHGFPINKKQVVAAVKNADRREKGEKERLIAQKVIDEKHVLRVVYERIEGKIRIITFYPGRRDYYES